MSEQYKAPAGPPPGYPQQPQQAYYEGGASDPRAMQGYASPPPNEYGAAPQQYPPQQGGAYGQPGPYGQPMAYGQPQPGPYGQQPMYYQQQPAPGGYYDNRGNRSGMEEGLCAGLLAACACCCCFDMLI